MNNIHLYGAGGHAKVIIDIIQSLNNKVGLIYDDNPSISECLETSVVDTKEINNNVPLIISIGNNAIRKNIVEKLGNITYANAIAPSATFSNYTKIGTGNVVMQKVVVQASVIIGNHIIINTGATVDHDCIIEDFVHIAPGVNLCGNVHIGEGTLVGVGSVVIPGIKIGKWVTINAGSVITKDIPDNAIVAGNPCRIIKIKQ